jgi:hypothetical protein
MKRDVWTLANTNADASLAWRCAGCGRLQLLRAPSPAPVRCPACGGSRFERAGPPHADGLQSRAMRTPAGIVLGPALVDDEA